ncbi:MAG: LysM peptidoglycan-binding domain-containing protein [Chloroflexi bacterium]|nr:MAG: LysM peptidoglycan-binding domain-containing protein [Chloroflexota bacterium]
MSKRWILPGALLIPLLLLSGCYRSASNDAALQGFDNPTTAPQIQATNTLPPAGPTATNTVPPVTRIAPTVSNDDATQSSAPVMPATNTPLATPFVPATNTATISPLVPATNTPVTPFVPPSATPTPQVITPSGPSLPVPIDTPTPLQPTATEASPLITPTQILINEDVPDECQYTVRAGDNLFRIALNNGVSLEALRAANPQVQGDIIQPGDILTLPDCGPNAQPSEVPQATATSSVSESSGGIIHIVQPGETLLQIARRYGTTVEALVEANNLTDPDNLTVNQELVIP